MINMSFHRTLNKVSMLKISPPPTKFITNYNNYEINEITFYSIFGDYIGRLSVFVAVMLLIVAFVKGRLKK